MTILIKIVQIQSYVANFDQLTIVKAIVIIIIVILVISVLNVD